MLNDLGAGFWLTLAGTLAIGWTVTAGRAALRRRRRVKRRESYLEGVRYLLDDESDRALEVFLGLSELDDSTVDTHFALGSLYRRRGEVERAIKVHEHIAERTNIDRRHRDTARTELAKDFFRAGLFDRAEAIFHEMADGGREPAVAWMHLVRIYEIQHDWKQAAAAHEQLSKVGAPEQPAAVAHYYCELAEEALAERDYATARSYLDRARAERPDFSRSAILRAELALTEGDPQLALELHRQVVQRDFHLLALVLPKLAEAARIAGDPLAFDAAIEEVIKHGDGTRAEIAYAAIVSGYYDDPLILECVREMLSSDSDLRDMAAAFIPEGTANLPIERVYAIAGALRNVVLRHARYRCRVCGIDSSTYLWHCPGCHSWDTSRAIAALEFLPRAARPRSPGA
jgi:lipopolysaccharide biosynthesis regulator YciM